MVKNVSLMSLLFNGKHFTGVDINDNIRLHSVVGGNLNNKCQPAGFFFDGYIRNCTGNFMKCYPFCLLPCNFCFKLLAFFIVVRGRLQRGPYGINRN